MTDSERVAVLETEMRHLKSAVYRIEKKQTEMYDLLNRGRGAWWMLIAFASVISFVGGLVANFAPWFFGKG